jgi:hypothetical protein
MRTYKGESLDTKTMYYDYFFKGQMYWVQGELYYNEKKKRFEHIHLGPRGGKYLIIWKCEI